MDLNSLLLMLTPIIGIGALGIYLMLAPGDDVSGDLQRRVGAGAAILSLVALGLLVGTRADWWPESAFMPKNPNKGTRC